MRRLLLTCSTLGLLAAPSLHAEELKVVSTVKPITMIVQELTQGVTSTETLLPAGASPHDYALRPSDARKLNEADLVIWVGPELEQFLTRMLEGKENVLTLTAQDSISFRHYGDGHEGHAHEQHGHDDHEGHAHEQHGHDDHEGHAHEQHGHDDHEGHGHEQHGHDDHEGHGHEQHGHDDHDGHGQEQHGHDDHESHGQEQHGHDDHEGHAHEQHGHDDHHGHSHEGVDPHLWLGPEQAIQAAQVITTKLAEIAPSHKEKFEANLANFTTEVKAAMASIEQRLAPVSDRGYFVFHDGYGYFEEQFGLNNLGHFTVDPDRRPGAKTLISIRNALKEQHAHCVFSEPQFSPAVVDSVIRGTEVNIGTLDPMGTDIAYGDGSYVEFLNQLGQSFSQCLR
ncbi:zinc ABC transporter substrate-binding protein ZnuA [Photobacterium gaetbulicola]|uniref:High-affinity zinc uptake system protein ZnuA n=1 Tax=Photobacterium gaetbulicola Gung47 TaxID=658445 RepID=A0A0C5WNL4_9GAMM|nr:zinc ABC transporter substrate-binding protein ZnuA [Photobacterium gaetbulicola]AJR07942.1 zinc ABC transporter periplasmic substrate-binding protein [Photobacterium gaetbulicola Gung47]PSU07841.1 zinc ABC transporter substrate-binding protein ZnuA [Photobacterium gaetbulicola]